MNEDPKRASLEAKKKQIENPIHPRQVSPGERMVKHLPDKLTTESTRTEAEESLVAIGIQFPEVIDSISSIVTSGDFVDQALAKIWQLICDVKDSGDRGYFKRSFI